MSDIPPSHVAERRFEVRPPVRRLVLARVFGLAKLSDVDDYGAAFAAPAIARVVEPILCADHRPVRIYSQPVSDQITSLFRSLNTRWTRVAILVSSTNATLAMQLSRIVRESTNPSRRVFTEGPDALAFLAEGLSPDELAAARTFLKDDAASQPTSLKKG